MVTPLRILIAQAGLLSSAMLAVALSPAALASAQESDAPTSPYAGAPIVLISLDTVRADCVTGFGGAPDATPVLAALAEQSILFETAIAASHHTAPSHASMLTGFSPFVHGVALGDDWGVLMIPEALPTLAEILRAEGYATAAFSDGIQLRAERGFDRGFQHFVLSTDGLMGKLDSGREFLEQTGQSPFFLFAHTYRAHAPYLPAEGMASQVIGSYDGHLAQLAKEHFSSSYSQAMTAKRSDASQGFVLPELRDDADRALMFRAYRGAVAATDRELGHYLAMLEQQGVLERAIVVVTSDHGEAFFEHDNQHHSDLFDEVIRVPLLVRLPDGRGAGRRISASTPSPCVRVVVASSNARPESELSSCRGEPRGAEPLAKLRRSAAA
ncbi:MAG: hypothetical protein DRQ55_17765, partial [Planctomycetota bacterium]